MEKEKRGSKFYQPHWVCEDCGRKAHEATYGDKFADPETGESKRQMEYSTWHEGICEACGLEKGVTERRDFFYPNFHPKNFPYIAEGLASGRIKNKLDNSVK